LPRVSAANPDAPPFWVRRRIARRTQNGAGESEGSLCCT
jgi:hypothetical protein